MDALLQEITALPKVLGCFLFSGKKGVTNSNMPPIFTKDTINTMGALLARSKKMGSLAKLDLEAIDIRYNETILIARPLNQNTVLVTICEPGTNRPLLDMSINMVISDISEAITTDEEQTASSPAESIQQADTPLKPILAKIKEALTEAIGPIAAPVLDDCYTQWSTQGPLSKKRLPDLAWMICKEIDDKNLETTFMERIKIYL